MARIDHGSGSTICTALRKLYPLPQYALLFEVASGMGATFGGYADAIAMGLFPSRGLDIEGFEFKTRRQDWLKEMKDPEKAEKIAKYCDFWWLVIGDESVAKPEEIPAGWGLYVMDEKDNLEVRKRPKKLKAIPPDRTFVGAMLRRANEMADRERRRALQSMDNNEFVQKLRGQITKELQKNYDVTLEVATSEYERLKEQVKAFEESSGIKINYWNGGRVGEAVNLLMNIKDGRDIDSIEELAKDIEGKAAHLKDAAMQLKQAGISFVSAGKLPT